MRLELGERVRCADGAVRELSDIVIDAAARRVTHLVVQPKGQHEASRLVSIQLAGRDSEGRSEIALDCTAEMLDRSEPVRESAYLRPGEHPHEDSEWDVGVEDVLVAPSYASPYVGEPDLDPNVSLMYDRVPKGEVELRRTSSVYSDDEHRVGRVDGVVLGGEDRIAQLLLERGHLWWRREIAVPAEAVARLESDLVTLGVKKRELKAFPSRPARGAFGSK